MSTMYSTKGAGDSVCVPVNGYFLVLYNIITRSVYMSGEAVKERTTPVYARGISK